MGNFSYGVEALLVEWGRTLRERFTYRKLKHNFVGCFGKTEWSLRGKGKTSVVSQEGKGVVGDLHHCRCTVIHRFRENRADAVRDLEAFS